MSTFNHKKYTKVNPFTYEGLHLWSDTLGNPMVEDRAAPRMMDLCGGLREARGLRAYLNDIEVTPEVEPEAEREGWRWTNADHREARNVRWEMRDDSDIWVLHHDDFVPGLPNIAPYWTDATTGVDDHRIAAVVRPVIDSFYTWLTEQEQPSEPTGFGAVVEVDGKRYLRDEAYVFTPWWRDGESGVKWAHILDQGPVTVLSEGVVTR